MEELQLQRLNPIQVGEDVEQILTADQVLEEKALSDLREGIAHCESVRDFVSRDLCCRSSRASDIRC